MASIAASIRHNIVNLARFSGRDSQGLFWPWAIIVYALLTLVTLGLTFVAVARGFMEMSGAFQPGAGPEDIEKLMAGMMGRVTDLWLPLTLVNLLMIVLLAASIARRLHDRGRTAYWGLLPVPFWIAGALTARRAMALAMTPGDGASRPALDTLIMLIGPFSWVAFIVLLVLLIGDGDHGPNAYGPDPKELSR